MRGILKKHDIDLGDILIFACVSTIIIGLFFS